MDGGCGVVGEQGVGPAGEAEGVGDVGGCLAQVVGGIAKRNAIRWSQAALLGPQERLVKLGWRRDRSRGRILTSYLGEMPPERRNFTMGIGAGVFLIAVGAILTFAVDVSVSGFDLDVVGIILMIAGAIGILVDLVIFAPRRRVGHPGTVVERERY